MWIIRNILTLEKCMGRWRKTISSTRPKGSALQENFTQRVRGLCGFLGRGRSRSPTWPGPRRPMQEGLVTPALGSPFCPELAISTTAKEMQGARSPAAAHHAQKPLDAERLPGSDSGARCLAFQCAPQWVFALQWSQAFLPYL